MQAEELKSALFDAFAYDNEYALVGLNHNFTFNFKNKSFWKITRQKPVKDFLYWIENKDKHKVKKAFSLCMEYPLESIAVDVELIIDDAHAWKHWEFIAIPNLKGKVLIYGLGKHISEVEQEIKWKHAKQVDYIIDSITDGLFIVNGRGEIVKINRALQVTLRMQEQDILGHYFWDVFDIHHVKQLKHLLQATIAQDRTVHVEEFYEASGVWLEINAYPFEDGLLIYLRDISQRKRDEAQLKKQNEELIEIARKYSHEIRRPVASILGLIQLINTAEFDEENKEVLNLLKRTSDELDFVIRAIVLKSYQATAGS